MVQFGHAGVSQGILILRLFEPAADVDVLTGLHEDFGADDRVELGPQPRHDLLHRRALSERLELDEHPRGVFAGIGAGRTGEADHPRNRRIVQENLRALVLDLGHRGKRGVLARLHRRKNEPGILLGKKSLRDHHVQEAGQHHQPERHQQYWQLVAEGPLQPAVIAVAQPLEAALEQVAPALFRSRSRASETARTSSASVSTTTNAETIRVDAHRHREFVEQAGPSSPA